MKRLLLWAALPLLLLSCTEKIHDPGKDNKGPVEGELVAVNGFYTLEHEGFKYKIREEEYNTPAAWRRRCCSILRTAVTKAMRRTATCGPR